MMQKLIGHILHLAKVIKDILVVWLRPLASRHAECLLKRVCEQKCHNNKAVIVFICQEASIWYSLQSVYEAAKKDEGVGTFILAVPEVTLIGKVIDNGIYEYFTNKGIDIIQAYDFEQKKWFDLKKLKPDYVFMPRPYDIYLPMCYRRMVVSKYAKCCYVPYGYLMEADEILECSYSPDYFKYVYMIFVEHYVAKNYLEDNMINASNKNLHRIYNVGYTRFDLTNIHSDACKLWKRKREEAEMRIVWTPRWTEDPKLGGTHFFEYKDLILEYISQHKNVELVFRPHPLLFSHFEQVGRMTHEEIVEYRQRYEQADNAVCDESNEYLELFYSSDALVADHSSVILDYIITGKPIIFCDGPTVYNECYERIMESFYIVHTWEELQAALENIRKGKDPKAELRKKMIDYLLHNSEGKVGETILNLIKTDFKG